MVKYKNIQFDISKVSNTYGRYFIRAKYKGRDVVAQTKDSECYDWLNDDSNKEKHLQAKRHAYSKIVEQYKMG